MYNQAVAEGAELIIGPLSKEHIQSLADSVTFTTPVLALNHIPGLQKDKLYQFGLSPIDDVEQITTRHKTMVIKKHCCSFLKTRWANALPVIRQKTGKISMMTILETQTYNPKETDFSSPIQKLLNLDESEQRYNKILALIPSA